MSVRGKWSAKVMGSKWDVSSSMWSGVRVVSVDRGRVVRLSASEEVRRLPEDVKRAAARGKFKRTARAELGGAEWSWWL